MISEFNSWRSRHFRQVGEYSWQPKSDAVEQTIRDEFARHAVSIRLEDAAGGIPEPVYSDYLFEWDDPHFKIIQKFRAANEVTRPDGTIRRVSNEGGYLAVLRQLTSGLIYTGTTENNQGYILSHARIDALESLIDTLQGPVLVAIYFRAEVEALLRRFGSAAKAFVGDTPPKERLDLINKWNQDQIPILIAAPSAMGHGINLQHGSSRSIVWFTHSFDWAQRAQFNARLVRSGQTKTISIINLVANAGLDRVVLDSLEKKCSGEKAILAALDIKHRFAPQESNNGAI
jgi:hypothetical protein